MTEPKEVEMIALAPIVHRSSKVSVGAPFMVNPDTEPGVVEALIANQQAYKKGEKPKEAAAPKPSK